MSLLSKLRSSVTTYLLARTFSIYIVVTIALTAVQMLMHYNQTLDYLKADRISLQKTLDPHIRHSLETLNYGSLQAALGGLLTNPSVIGVKLTGARGQTLFAGGTHQDQKGYWARLQGIGSFLEGPPSQFLPPEVFGRPSELISRYRDQGQLVGALHLYADQRPAFERVQHDFGLILINAFIKTVVIWAVFIYFARILISRPLSELANAAKAVDFKNPELVQAKIEVKLENELSLLRDTFNHMAQRLYQDFLTTQRLQKGLTEQNRYLEETVQERTVELDERNHDLREALSGLRLYHNQMLDSIRYAERIKAALLPSQSELARHLPGCRLINQPKEIVGGDFCYLWTEPKALVVGMFDCTGHGIPGALMTMTSATILRHLLTEMDPTRPDLILKQLDSELRSALHETKEDAQNDEGLDGALVYLDLAQKRLLFVGAYLPLIYSDPQGELKWIEGDRCSVGYRYPGRNRGFEVREVELKPGRRFYLPTDGCWDQKGGISGFPMGKEQFRQWLEDSRHLGVDEQVEQLEERMAQWSLGRGPTDDRCLLIFQWPFDSALES